MSKSEFLINLMFKFYLFLNRIQYKLNIRFDENRQRYYDHLGLIDTLGYSSERSPLTANYSCELYSIFSIRIPSRWLVLYEGCGEKYLYISKEPF